MPGEQRVGDSIIGVNTADSHLVLTLLSSGKLDWASASSGRKNPHSARRAVQMSILEAEPTSAATPSPHSSLVLSPQNDE